MRRLVLQSAGVEQISKNTTPVDFAAMRKFPLIAAEPKRNGFLLA
jgi:hypothetical protein